MKLAVSMLSFILIIYLSLGLVASFRQGFVLTSLQNNGNSPPPPSSVKMDLIVDVKNHPKFYFSSLFGNQTSTENRWKRFQSSSKAVLRKATEGRRGLLMIIVPILATQFRILQTLYSSLGLRVLKYSLWTGVAVGLLKLVQDTYKYGPNLLPILPQEDSYALVTGASSGLGRELAIRFYKEGFNVVLVASNETKLTETKDLLLGNTETITNTDSGLSRVRDDVSSSRSQDIQVISCNLENPFSSFLILKELKRRGIDSKIDILVCNAGRGLFGPIEKESYLRIRQVLDVNLAETVGLIRLLLPRMIYRKQNCPNVRSRVVIVSSINSEAVAENLAIYTASKAFLTSFGQSLRRELFRKGILVTVALPGPIHDTNFHNRTLGSEHKPIKLKIPGLATSVKFNSDQIFRALRSGHEIVIPGIQNQFFYHILCKLLPSYILADLMNFGWKSSHSESKGLLPGVPSSVQIQQKNYSNSGKKLQFGHRPQLSFPMIRNWWKAQFHSLRHSFQHKRQKSNDQVNDDSISDREDSPTTREDCLPFDREEAEEEQHCEKYFEESLREFDQRKEDHHRPYSEAATSEEEEEGEDRDRQDLRDDWNRSHHQEGLFEDYNTDSSSSLLI